MRKEQPNAFEHLLANGPHFDEADAVSSLVAAIEAAETGNSVDHRSVRAHAVTTLRLRRAREALFGAGLFGDGAWDVLLTLLIAKVDQHRTTMKEACVAAAVPTTTALRCIGRLESQGAVHRRRYERGKRVWLELDNATFVRLALLMTGRSIPEII
jgi:hypothetical protein